VAGRFATTGGDPSGELALPVLAFAAVVSAVLATYVGTLLSMASTWASSDTYGHGFAVLPAALWLVYRQRRELAATEPRVCWGGLPLLGAFVTTWMLGRWCDVAVLEQASLLAMVPAALLLVLGREYLARIAFPAGFALLAVPVGDFLLSPLMSVTAAGAVALLHGSGIESYRDGWIIATPAGRFVVAEACSGLRYLIASFATGLLFAHLFLRGLGRQLAFVALAVGVPLLGNIVRAWMIIALAGPAGTRLVVGADHLLHGCLMFLVFMVPVLAVGLLLAGRQPSPPRGDTVYGGFGATLARQRRRHACAAGAGLTILLAGPLGHAALGTPAAIRAAPEIPAALMGAVAAGPAARPRWLRPGTGWDMRHIAYGGEHLSFEIHHFRQGSAGADIGTLRQQLAGETVTLAADVEIVAQSGAVS
jgi:exosortase A